MSLTRRRSSYAALLLGAAATLDAAVQLPGSSGSPYLVPIPENTLWTTTAIMTSGDTAANGFRLAGILDGMGAFDNGDGTFTVLVNHEIGSNRGIIRSHGGRGAFLFPS